MAILDKVDVFCERLNRKKSVNRLINALLLRTYTKKPGFYGKFIILTNGLYEETRFLGSSG
jgi:hypothetical protein